MTGRAAIAAAGILGFLGVACGAFGAHALKARLSPDLLANWNTAAHYQMIHSLALLGVGLLLTIDAARKLAALSAICFAVGIVIFSGSLYALALTGAKWLGAITPFGGLSLLAGWLLLASGRAGAESRRCDS